MKKIKTCGQATVEYIFILAFALFLGRAAVLQFRTFFQNEMGKVGHVLSTHLVIGVCPDKCWFAGYQNGFR
ncbi:MAG: hypothetical protein ACJ76H_04300 [Bacteriovoracaceae bacterium]